MPDVDLAAIRKQLIAKFAQLYLGDFRNLARPMAEDAEAAYVAAYEQVDLDNQRLTAELAAAKAILTDLTEWSPCSFDHHGYCQAHGWLTYGECPHARAQRLLAPTGLVSPEPTEPTEPSTEGGGI